MRLTVPMARLSPGGRIGVLRVSVVAPVVLGSPIEDLPVLVRFGPLLCPTVRQSGVTDKPDGMVAGRCSPLPSRATSALAGMVGSTADRRSPRPSIASIAPRCLGRRGHPGRMQPQAASGISAGSARSDT